MDAISKFQYLSLVQKIMKELDNNIGMGEESLAEFIIHLIDDHPILEDFEQALKETGADFTKQFTATLYKLIVKMKPKHYPNSKKDNNVTTPHHQSNGKIDKEQDIVTRLIDSESKSKKAYLENQLKSSEFPSQQDPRDRISQIDDRRHHSSHFDSHKPSEGYPREVIQDLDEFRRNRRVGDVSSYHSTSGYHGLLDSPDEQDVGGKGSRQDDSFANTTNRYRQYRAYYDDDASSSHQPRSRGERPSTSTLDEHPVINKIYKGVVHGVKEFGCFVVLDGIRNHPEGLVHISDISADRIVNIQEQIKRGRSVFAKVKTYSGKRIGLSMKEVDQSTGKDLMESSSLDHVQRENEVISSEFCNPFPTSLLDQVNAEADEMETKRKAMVRFCDDRGHRAKQRISSPDRFEWAQLERVGAVAMEELPDYEEEHGLITGADRNEDLVDQEVELNDDQPIFLRGYLGQAGQISPAKIVKNPHGSLHWAALTQSALSKERRELRDAKNIAWIENMNQDDHYSFRDDPMFQIKDHQLVEAFMKQTLPDIPEWKKSAFGLATKLGRTTNLTIIEQRRMLPIYAFRDQLLRAVHENPILIVVGETGSGKTTQLTQYLAEAGYSSRGRIGCTQPRRVAATSVSQRVAEEVGCRLGEQVGYSIRFEDMTSPETCIKYMTDGMLLCECLVDPDLNRYACVILDEAHERSIHTDVLMGLMKQAISRRPDLRLIVTSATLDAEKFSNYFYSAPIFTIPGRTYPVEILWTREPETDYLDATLVTVLQIHINEPPGDILVFLTGQEEIDTACQILFERMKKLGSDLPELIILPIYSALPSEMQSKIFDPAPPGARKVIIGTNIAETSVTIDGIYYVVDPGFVKQKVYNPKTGMDALIVCPISKAQAKQRSGRAGRTGPGKCYRLYTEAAYNNEMLDSPVPEIQRTNLANTVLTMKALGINEVFKFDFMDKPAEAQLYSAMHTLFTLGALDEEGLLTRIGRKMADFPLEPQLAKMLLTSVELGCSEEVLSIVAMLSVQNVFYRPKEKAQLADQKRSKFFQNEGDHLTLLTVYVGWKASRFSNPWCFENFIQARSMRRAQDVRKQLLAMMDRYKLDIVSCGKNYNQVRMAIVSGFFANAAKKDPQEGHLTLVESTPVYIHPSSSLFQRNPQWVIYHELVQTTKEYMREVISIEPKWLEEFAPKFYKMADPNKMTKRKKRERLEPLFDKWRDPNEWRLSKRKG